MRKIEAGQYRSAIEILDDLLDTDPTNHVAHYYLARCFSQLGDERQSLLHLDQAIEFGYEDFDHIEEDYALVHLRNCANFQAFRANDYQIPEHLPAPQNDLLSNRQTRSDASEKSNFPNYQLDGSISSVGVYERQNRG